MNHGNDLIILLFVNKNLIFLITKKYLLRKRDILTFDECTQYVVKRRNHVNLKKTLDHIYFYFSHCYLHMCHILISYHLCPYRILKTPSSDVACKWLLIRKGTTPRFFLQTCSSIMIRYYAFYRSIDHCLAAKKQLSDSDGNGTCTLIIHICMSTRHWPSL